MNKQQLNRFALSSSMDRDERIFNLKMLLENKKVRTVQSAMKQLNVSKPTVLSYLKELNIAIVDADTGQLTKTFTNDTTIILPFD